jgi:hypothetical protein
MTPRSEVRQSITVKIGENDPGGVVMAIAARHPVNIDAYGWMEGAVALSEEDPGAPAVKQSQVASAIAVKVFYRDCEHILVIQRPPDEASGPEGSVAIAQRQECGACRSL